MPDFKKIWPELLYKILMAALAIIFGYNQYHDKQEQASLHARLDQISAHTDYLDPYAGE